MRDIAALLNITERATQRIVADLDRSGYIDREREGRRNRYTVGTHLPLGLPIQRDIDIRSLLGSCMRRAIRPERRARRLPLRPGAARAFARSPLARPLGRKPGVRPWAGLG